MALRDHFNIGKLYSCLASNQLVFPDLEINKQLRKKDNIIANVKNEGIYHIFFTYKTQAPELKSNKLRKMRLIYDPFEDYQFKVWAESKNLRHSKNYDVVNGEARQYFEMWFPKGIMQPAGINVSNLGKMRGKKIDSSLIIGDDSEEGKIVGYVITRKEPFYKDISKLKMEIYDDLDGLSMLCNTVDVLIENMVIEKKERSSPGDMFK